MGIVSWFKAICYKQKFVCKCPKCKSTNITSFSVISNFVQVVRDSKTPNYVESYKCNDCGYTTQNIEELL